MKFSIDKGGCGMHSDAVGSSFVSKSSVQDSTENENLSHGADWLKISRPK